MADGIDSTDFATKTTGKGNEPPWIKIDLGTKPCYITKIQIKGGSNTDKAGFLKVIIN